MVLLPRSCVIGVHVLLFLLLLCSPAISVGFTILDEIFAYVTVSLSSVRSSHIASSWMVHAGCFCCWHSPV